MAFTDRNDKKNAFAAVRGIVIGCPVGCGGLDVTLLFPEAANAASIRSSKLCWFKYFQSSVISFQVCCKLDFQRVCSCVVTGTQTVLHINWLVT